MFDNLIKVVKYYEGCELTAYKPTDDPTEPWTIGYGHTGPEVTQGVTITQEQADQYLAEDVRKRICRIDALNLGLKNQELQALASFVYNLGMGNFLSSTLLRFVREGRTDMVAVSENSSMRKFLPDNIKELPAIQWAFLNWIKDAGIPLRGLYRRRYTESVLYLEDKLIFPPFIPEK
jgi:lysozyme